LEETDWTGYELLMSRALDRAENTLPSVIERLNSGQRLILYCGLDLVAKLERQEKCKSETHSVPHSEARLIAIFSG
jgi:hypothetical protein